MKIIYAKVLYFACNIFLEQCQSLPSPQNGGVNEILIVNEIGASYSGKYYCDPGYTLVGGNRVRKCDPKARIFIDNKFERPQYSGDDPLCKGIINNFVNNETYDVKMLLSQIQRYWEIFYTLLQINRL